MKTWLQLAAFGMHLWHTGGGDRARDPNSLPIFSGSETIPAPSIWLPRSDSGCRNDRRSRLSSSMCWSEQLGRSPKGWRWQAFTTSGSTPRNSQSASISIK